MNQNVARTRLISRMRLKMRLVLGVIICMIQVILFGQDIDHEKLYQYYSVFEKARSYQNSNLDSADVYANRSMSLAKELESDYYYGKSLQLKTRGEFLRSEVDSAIIYGNMSIEILREFPDSIEYFLAEYNQGNFYLSKDDNIQALIQFKKATKIVDENFETYVEIDKEIVTLNRAYCQASIGIVLDNLEDYQGALESFQTALKISYKVESVESELFRSVVMNRIGNVYVAIGDYAKAESYAVASMEQKKKLGQESSIGYSYRVMAESAYGRKKYDLALKYLDLSNKKFGAKDNWNELDRNTFIEAKCYAKKGKNKIALKKLKEVESVYLNRFNKSDQVEFYEVLAGVHSELGDHELANDYLRITLKLKEQLFAKEERKVVGEFVNFIEKGEDQLNTKIENLKNSQEKEKLELQIEAEKEKKIWIYTLFLVSIVCLVLIILIISNAYRRNKKVTQELSLKVEENKILFKEVHHRVKNNFQIISSLLNLQYGIEEDQRSRKVLTDAQGRIQSMSLVHEMLYRKNEVKRLDFSSYANELTTIILRSFNVEENIEFEVVSGREYFDLEVAIPLGLILNEAITNSVKYAFKQGEKGKIKIELTKGEDKNYLLEIKDNGVGLSDDFLNKIEETLGLELINILSEQLEGSVKFYNDNGTTMKVMFKG